MNHPFVTAWKVFRPTGRLKLLHADRGPLLNGRSVLAVRGYTRLDHYAASEQFGTPNETSLHLGLLPMPFAGSLARADIFVLMLNPGLSPTDYFGERRVRAYRDALRANLAGLAHRFRHPFMFLDPQYSWHAGFEYWHGKLTAIIAAWARKNHTSYAESLRFFSARLASLELVPYHSRKFGVPNRILRTLESARLARAYVHDVIAKKARRGDALVLVTRSARHWALRPSRNVIVYNRAEARAAHLTPNSRGGRAILSFVRRRGRLVG